MAYVTIGITSNDIEDGRIAIDVPLPVGTYTNFTFELFDGENIEPIFTKTLSGTYNIARRSMLYTAETALIGSTSMSVKGAKSITVNSKTISVRMPYGSDVTSLRTAFSGDATITVNGEIVTNNVANIDFSDPVTLAIGDNTYTVTISYSNLPIVYITTPDHVGITSKETYIEKSSFVIGNTENGKYDLSVAEGLNIKGRGNSTWGYPKKPYAVKFDKKQSILGMPKDKSWVLLANWMDRTVMRNAVSFEIAKKTKALAWTPNGDFVEVVLNGKFLGNYYLCEKIKISSDRVNITEIDNTKNVITEGDDLTGGYLVELDTYYDETYKFKTATRELPVNFKSPDEDVPDEQINYLKAYFDNIESILYSDDFPANTGNYEDLIDVDSFIDWWFVHELSGNAEPVWPKSSYMHKDKLGKLIAGPIWDFDWATYIPGRTSFRIAGAIWYGALFKDPVFVTRVKEKWSESKSDFESVLDFIDIESERIKDSAEYNCELWPINRDTNGDETLDYLSAVTRLRAAYVERIGVLDKLINNL